MANDVIEKVACAIVGRAIASDRDRWDALAAVAALAEHFEDEVGRAVERGDRAGRHDAEIVLRELRSLLPETAGQDDD